MNARLSLVFLIGLVAAGCGSKQSKCDKDVVTCSNKCDEDHKKKKPDGTFDNDMEEGKAQLWSVCIAACNAAHDACRGK